MEARVSASGPFFAGHPSVLPAIEDTIKALVNEGEREVKGDLRPGHGLITGHYRDSVHGDITSSLHGVVSDSNVIYGPWLEGVSSRNESTKFKGYSMFRKATQKLERIAARTLADAVARLASRLNG